MEWNKMLFGVFVESTDQQLTVRLLRTGLVVWGKASFDVTPWYDSMVDFIIRLPSSLSLSLSFGSHFERWVPHLSGRPLAFYILLLLLLAAWSVHLSAAAQSLSRADGYVYGLGYGYGYVNGNVSYGY